MLKSLTLIIYSRNQFGFCCVYIVFAANNLEQVIHFLLIPILLHSWNKKKQKINHPGGCSLFTFPENGPSWVHGRSHSATRLPLLDPPAQVPLARLTAGQRAADQFVGPPLLLHHSGSSQHLLSPSFRLLEDPSAIVKSFYMLFHRVLSLRSQLVWTLIVSFGTAVFAFEGISLVLPLQKDMRTPRHFEGLTGVLNTGMVVVSALYFAVGFYGYLKYGDDIRGSITLNLPADEMYYVHFTAPRFKRPFNVQTFVYLQFSPSRQIDGNFYWSSRLVILIVGDSFSMMECTQMVLAILGSYAVQFYVPMEIVWPSLSVHFNPGRSQEVAEYVFRTVIVLITCKSVTSHHLDHQKFWIHPLGTSLAGCLL